MPEGKRRSRSQRRERTDVQFNATAVRVHQPFLVIATDICLWSTIIVVAIGFGGRMASGQLALVIGASATTICWLLHQLTCSEPKYTWTGSELLWGAGILVAAAQMLHLPTNLLLMISPRIKEILPLWFNSESASNFALRWDQLSLAPWETASALATFVSYALLFLVTAQRTRTVKDVERMLCLVALSSIAMMLFAQLQFWTSNGKFFWSYDHPYMKTDTYPLGVFTNRNHLAQFLVLGASPLIWWLLRRLQQQTKDEAKQKSMPPVLHLLAIGLMLFSLGGITLTILMTLSRGGLMALVITSSVAIAIMCRIGLASVRFGIGLLLVGLVTGGLFSFSKYESILAGRMEQNSGRSEIWLANIKVAGDFPILGTGIGTHGDAYQLHIDSKDDGMEYSHAESGYLQIASESGLAGLIVAGLMIATCFWWCAGALWNTDTDATSAAAAILASLTANVLHAIGDFFWYTPVCMLLLAVQLACATRLFRLARQQADRPVYAFTPPRVLTALVGCALVPVVIWMFDLKQPAALAEPHRMQALLLARPDERDVTEEETAATNEQRIREAILAAKLNPRDAKLQESAGAAYLELFEIKQAASETPMSANMLRDAVKGSGYETIELANRWLDTTFGANMKLLRSGARAIRRSLANGPLRSRAYVLLTEVHFLDHEDDAKFQESCLKQALSIRPQDADMMFLVGKSGMQQADMDKALAAWRPAFERSPRMQVRIARVLAEQNSPEFFEQEFHPDWKALKVIGEAFADTGHDAEATQVKRLYVQRGLERSQKMKSDDELESTLISVRNTCRELGDIPAAASVLSYGVKRLPHSYSIRYMLSLDLIATERTADAAEHLKWCATQRPDDENLQKVSTLAVAERLKHAPSTAQKDRDNSSKSYRR